MVEQKMEDRAKEQHRGFFEETPGSFTIKLIYLGMFALGYLLLFWEVAHRWPVR
ncbi:MAG: hypothetical protein GWN58_21070 [Anaerolineae bacterium]|nr:hypothetical protein [Anaerolineae bacterium]